MLVLGSLGQPFEITPAHWHGSRCPSDFMRWSHGPTCVHTVAFERSSCPDRQVGPIVRDLPPCRVRSRTAAPRELLICPTIYCLLSLARLFLSKKTEFAGRRPERQSPNAAPRRKGPQKSPVRPRILDRVDIAPYDLAVLRCLSGRSVWLQFSRELVLSTFTRPRS